MFFAEEDFCWCSSSPGRHSASGTRRACAYQRFDRQGAGSSSFHDTDIIDPRLADVITDDPEFRGGGGMLEVPPNSLGKGAGNCEPSKKMIWKNPTTGCLEVAILPYSKHYPQDPVSWRTGFCFEAPIRLSHRNSYRDWMSQINPLWILCK